MTIKKALPGTVRRPDDRRRLTGMPARRTAGALAVAFATLLVAGCSEYQGHSVTVGAIPDDYRTRHPIVVSEQEQTLDVPVAAEDRKLPSGVLDMVSGYAARYRSQASGAVRVMIPHGSVNMAAAEYVAPRVRAALIRSGVPSSRIISEPYDASASIGDAPIHLSYLATAASAGPCGAWPEDLAQDTNENRNYENFGCASQSNLAAQIANPSDLIAPRGMTPSDAERRAQVYQKYVTQGSSAGASSSGSTGGGSSFGSF